MVKVTLTEEQEKLFSSCEWCSGSGTERAHMFDTGYGCPDCEGTGMKGGKEAEKEFDRLVDEMCEKGQKDES